jgi:hypothetical protein
MASELVRAPPRTDGRYGAAGEPLNVSRAAKELCRRRVSRSAGLARHTPSGTDVDLAAEPQAAGRGPARLAALEERYGVRGHYPAVRVNQRPAGVGDTPPLRGPVELLDRFQ